jgi:hypothetical protein
MIYRGSRVLVLAVLGVSALSCGELPEEDPVAAGGEGTGDPSSAPSGTESQEQAFCPAPVRWLCDRGVKNVSGGSTTAEAAFATAIAGATAKMISGDYVLAGKLIYRTLLGMPHAVNFQERLDICKATGGLGVTSIDVGPCSGGSQQVSPHGFPSQTQSCAGNAATGGHYDQSQCIYKDREGLYFWDDGPSVPPEADNLLPARFFDSQDGRYAILFWPAGQKHDYCYHHNPTSYGHLKQNCDAFFLDNMNLICDQNFSSTLSWFNKKACQASARIMYQAVVSAGETAYRTTKTDVNYENRTYRPLPSNNGTPDPVCENECGEKQTRRADCSCTCSDDDERACNDMKYDWNGSTCGCTRPKDF